MVSEPESNIGDTIGQVTSILKKGRWWICAAAFLVPLIAIEAVMLLPNRYTSEATLVVVQQQIAPRYLDASTNPSTPDLVKTMSWEILSRNRLYEIIQTFGLFPKERDQSPEILADKLRKQIEIEPLDQIPGRLEFSAFKISLSADNPVVAQQLTSRLTSLFIEENLRTRGKQAAATTDFITEQMEAAKQRFNQQEQRLKEFRQRNIGQLPEQSQTALQEMTELRLQLQEVNGNITRLQQQRASLESPVIDRLTRLRNERNALMERLTERHPEVLRKDQEIARAQWMLGYLRTAAAGAIKTDDPTTLDDPEFVKLRDQASSNFAEAQNLNREQGRLRSEIARRQDQLRLSPLREQELTDILREYEVYKQDYKDLQNKQLQAKMASTLEEQYPGKSFRVIDPATLPIKPSSPKRLKISLGALGAGLALGLALAFGRQLLSPTFRDEKDLRKHLGNAMVVGIPYLTKPEEQRWAKQKAFLEFLAASVMMVTVLAAEFYVFRHG